MGEYIYAAASLREESAERHLLGVDRCKETAADVERPLSALGEKPGTSTIAVSLPSAPHGDKTLTLRSLLRRHWAPLVLMWLAHVGMGATNALPGSCLLVLASRVGATLSVMGLWYTVKSATACLLAVLTGCLFPRLRRASRHQLVFLLGANLLCAGAVLAVPLARRVWAVLGLAGVLGAGHSALETADGILAILLFGSQHSRPILQSLHFSVALGALAAPALMHISAFGTGGGGGDGDINATAQHLPQMCFPASGGGGSGNETAELPDPASPVATHQLLHPPLLAPFAIVHVVQLLAAFGFLGLLVHDCVGGSGGGRRQLRQYSDLLAKRETPLPDEPQTISTPSKPDLPVGPRRLLIALTVAFYFCFVGVENVFWSHIGAYGVCSPTLRLPALNAAFFAGFLAGRALGIAAAHWARPAVILLADLAGCQAALAALCLAGGSPRLTVAATAAFGLSVSTMFASGISWLAERLEVAGPLACSWIIGSQLGVSVLPALAGHLLASPLGPAGVLYLAVAGFACASACFLAMLVVARGPSCC